MMDPRPLGALLAGLPCSTSKPGGWIATEWPYEKIQNKLEEAYGMPNLGADATSSGLRGNIMRTPGQRQQNFALECLMNEAAAAAKADPIQFRKDHTTEPRLIELLDATAKAAGWEPRPSPHRNARKAGSAAVTGRGVGIMLRENAYWVGIAEVAVTPSTGAIKVTKFTIGVDPAKIINPRYKILTMEETPEIKIVQISRNDKGFGGGSEAANAIVPPAVAAAIFDATGIQPRRIPLTPEYVAKLLNV
jgi:nicotinate dehydrogenase subunit B